MHTGSPAFRVCSQFNFRANAHMGEAPNLQVAAQDTSQPRHTQAESDAYFGVMLKIPGFVNSDGSLHAF